MPSRIDGIALAACIRRACPRLPPWNIFGPRRAATAGSSQRGGAGAADCMDRPISARRTMTNPLTHRPDRHPGQGLRPSVQRTSAARVGQV